MAAAELAFRAGLADLDVAEAARRPTLAPNGVIALDNSDFGDLFDADQLIADLAAAISMPIFQGGRLEAEVDRAYARARELANAYGQSALSAAINLKNALDLSSAYDVEMALRKESVTAAELSDQIASERYSSGQVSLLAVLETRRALNSAQSELIGATEAALNARVDLALAAGGDWGAPQAYNQGI